MNKLFFALRESFEKNSKLLQDGKVFHPSYLKKQKFTKHIFPQIVKDIRKRLDIDVKKEVDNPFPDVFELETTRQRVDYVFGNLQHPKFFLELESIDRAQLYLFLADEDKLDDSKLWYYWATVCKHLNGYPRMPRYFVFLLILPEEKINNLPFWDAHEYQIFSPRLRQLIEENPFGFYDRMIKTSARLFIEKRQWLYKEGKWIKDFLQKYQGICELVFVTATERRLIMSRGKDNFNSSKEKYLQVRWDKKSKK